MALIPATILTGFLGSGKTTLLKRVLTEAHGQKIAVVENEFGEENIDNEILVADTTENIIQMSNGCICCTIRDDLRATLADLAQKKRKGELDFLRTPATNDLAVFIRAEFKDPPFAEANRDKWKCFTDPLPLPGALPGQVEIQYPDEVKERKLRLQIRYVPNDEGADDTWKCWLLHDRSEPFGITMLADGGSLTLQCVGCAADSQRELLLRVK